MSELLNRKSGSRSSQIPFHVVSLIPRAGFQKRFTVSVLQSYAPFNVGVFWGGGESGFSQNMCVLHQPAVDCMARGGEAAMWPPGSEARVDAAGQPAGVSPGAPLASLPLPTSLPASFSPVQASMGFAPANGARAPCL